MTAMSIWGKILGGATGFALGGPLGALLGIAAGHAVDRMAEPAADDELRRQVAFSTSVIVLGAKMAKADGVVTRDEVEAFRQVLHVPPEDEKAVGRIFDQAKKDAYGFEPYARQVAKMFAGQPAVLEQLLDSLFHIAKADGQYHPGEKDYLEKVAALFGFSTLDFERIEARHVARPGSDAYAILGVSREMTDGEIKAAYRKLIRENHPDKLVSEGLPQEFIDQANDKMAAINAAYDTIEKERGMK